MTLELTPCIQGPYGSPLLQDPESENVYSRRWQFSMLVGAWVWDKEDERARVASFLRRGYKNEKTFFELLLRLGMETINS